MQQASKSVTPQTSQFTFSMDSESGKALYGAQGIPPPARPVNHANYPQQADHHQQQPLPPPAAGNANPQQQPKQPRPRKPISRLYQLAARQRRLNQEYTNFHHPPEPKEVWICEFCEYEAIFGTEPAALVRQYEEKDRRERKRLAEKRRLLEKAKMKGRKNRKGSKKKNKNANQQQQQQANIDHGQAQYDADAGAESGLGAQDDEFFDDEFDDEPIEGAHQPGGPPPPPTPTKELQQERLAGVGNRAGGTGGGGIAGGGQTQPQAKPPGRTRRA